MKKDRENSFLARCAYGAADIYGGGAFVVIGTFFTVFLTNNTDGELNVKVVVYDGESNKEKDSTTKTVAAHTDESFRMGFGYGSDGTKMVYYKVFTVDADYNETLCFQEGNFDIHVSHSMWKNTSTYVTIVIIVLVVVVIVVIFMRSRTKKVVGGGKSFTELEAERKAKKTNKVAQKQTYKAGEKKSRK